MKALIVSILSKMGVAATGPVGWLVSLVVDRFLIWAEVKGRDLIALAVEFFRQRRQGKVDEDNQDRYQQTIGEGSAPTQEELENSTSDGLNGRKR